MTKEEIYTSAYKKWGPEAQLDMIVEECAELIKAVTKYKRADKATLDKAIENLVDELADVEIMIEQTKHLYQISQVVKARKHFKINRLKNRLKG